MNARLVQRVQEEIDGLALEMGLLNANRNRITSGVVRVDGLAYIGVIVRDIAVRAENFAGVKSVNMLALLPENYPRVPPLGVYLDRPYKATSSHFVHKGYHGAPTLNNKGWFWFCHALGDFNRSESAWRPGSVASEGHNLATVFCAARVSLAQ